MNSNRLIIGLGQLAVAVTLLGATALASAQPGDISQGAALFATHCAECHSMKEGKNKKGPSLFATFGAKAGQREGFAYSEALRNSQLVWNTETLSRYIANPKTTVAGGKMKYEGLAAASERNDLIAYLAHPVQ